MEIKILLEKSLRDAMRGGDDVAKRTIRMIMAAVKLAEVDKGSPLDEAGLIAILHKEIKNRREAIAEAEKARRPDLVSANQAEIQVIEPFLPKAMPEAEVLKIVHEAIHEVGALTPADMGKVMKAVLPRLQGRVPNDQVSQIVRKALQPSHN